MPISVSRWTVAWFLACLVFALHIVDDVKDAKPRATGELVMHEVQTPTGVRPRLHKDWRPRANRMAASLALS